MAGGLLADRIQIRRDTASNWSFANPVLAQGEIAVELDTYRMKIGNGNANWNNLPYFESGDIRRRSITPAVVTPAGTIIYFTPFVPPTNNYAVIKVTCVAQDDPDEEIGITISHKETNSFRATTYRKDGFLEWVIIR